MWKNRKKHDEPQGCQNTSHYRRQQNTYWDKTWQLERLSETWKKTLSGDVIKYGYYTGPTTKYIQHDASITKKIPSDIRRWEFNTQEHSTKIHFDKKMANKAGEGFILTTKLYNSANDAALLAPKNLNPEGKEVVQLKVTSINKQ